ncbi:MAG TPA: DUF1116 domain-containing protein [Anaerolineales bacterium]
MINKLFEQDLQVINVGLSSFADSIQQTGGKSLQLDWRPPASGNREIGMNLAVTVNDPMIEEANRTAHDRFLSAQPILMGVEQAGRAITGLGERTLLHAGPPIEWTRMCGPMQGAVIGAIMYEGWAEDQDEARQLADNGAVGFSPCHHFGAVGPMSGVISPSMPVWMVKNQDQGNMSYSNLNEGLGKVLRFGANDASVLERLKWMESVLGPAMNVTIQELGGIELRPIIAQALHMGDECHNRNAAASSLLFKKLTPALLKTDLPLSDITQVLEFIAGNDHFFLNISMACCKSMLDAGHGVEHSTLVTAMARNGVDFGIRVSGSGDAWFTAPAPMVDGLFFPGYSQTDAAPDLGDSAITETAGIGGFSMGAAPAIVQFVGGTPQDAIAYTREMYHVTIGVNGGFTLPPLNFESPPAGIDVRKVVDTGIAPIINTGIAHKDAGVGQVGAGITRAPLECFEKAIASVA